jgi:nucleoside-diphosphate-sugar epimerase
MSMGHADKTRRRGFEVDGDSVGSLSGQGVCGDQVPFDAGDISGSTIDVSRKTGPDATFTNEVDRLRIFVTGGTGFIGGHLCARLVARGDEVVALVRSPGKAAAVLPAGVATFAGDLSVFADPATELPPADVVVHLAGVVAAKSLAEYEQTNHAAVGHVVTCVSRQRWRPERLVFASSLAAAGPSPEGSPWTEHDPLHPVDPYGDAKARAEIVVRGAPFPTTVFRPPIVLGPGDEASLPLFRAARSGLGFRVAGPPQKLSFVDVRDLVEALVLMVDDRRPGAQCYYASHPAATDVRELWRELGRAVGKSVVVAPVPRPVLYLAMLASTLSAAVFGFKNQLDAKQYKQMVASAWLCASDRLRDDLGWRPRHDLADCLANAAGRYREARLLRS